MASIIEGFSYDIFISYRQKDNKFDGWVTRFVGDLKKELEATFKDDISIYFDENPHDGLLEMHNVDKSLEGKLKSLIFIPIISQTYCDTKSFAWQNEFCAFSRRAKEDQFGRDIKLSGGNVTSRILPVKIHDLDPEDRTLLENELGGVLRSIDFIYKSAGVNRPLRANEDHPLDNLNKTYYRDQVNKIANAIKEIFGGLKNPSSSIGIHTRKDSSNISKSNSEPFESIAVLAFANMSGDPQQEFFSDGISEEIINMLAQVPGLKVAGRTSSFSFKGKNQDLRTIGEQLNVNYILEGSVRKSGNKIRITSQLIKVADGYHLWSEKYDRELKDIFDIQDEISFAILNTIEIKLFGATQKAVLRKYTDNPEAYQLYLQGRFYHNKFAGPDGLNKAIEYFKAAIKIEPEYSLAYAGIAFSYQILWLMNYLPPEESLPQMKQAIQHSLQLDDSIAESHSIMGSIKMYHEWDFAGATVEFKKAIKLNPNFAEAHERYATCICLLGDYEEATKHASIAYILDPYSLLNIFNVAVVYWMTGDGEKELEYGRRLVELEPNFYGGHLHVAGGLQLLKRYDEAVSEAEMALHQNYDSFSLRVLGQLYGNLGDKVKAREVIKKMKNLKSSQSISNYDIGVVCMSVGEFDSAFQYFEKALKIHEGKLIYIKANMQYFPEFIKDPRTKKLLEKIGMPYQ